MEIQTNWAKVFDTEYGQVLMYWVYDSDEEKDVMHCMIKIPACLVDMRVESEKEDIIPDEFREKATQETADSFAREAFNLHTQFETTPQAQPEE